MRAETLEREQTCSRICRSSRVKWSWRRTESSGEKGRLHTTTAGLPQALSPGGRRSARATHLRQLFRKSRLLFSSAMLLCSLYCNSCLHRDKEKGHCVTDAGPERRGATYRCVLPASQSPEEQQREKGEIGGGEQVSRVRAVPAPTPAAAAVASARRSHSGAG